MFRDRAIIFLAIGQTLQWAGLFYIFPALFLQWEQAFGWTKPQITGAITVAILISALFSPLAGRIIDKGKGAELMSCSAVLGGACLFLLSYVSDLKSFYFIWAGIGITMAGCLYEPCFTMITRARGVQAKRGIIIVTLVAGFAGTISFPTTHNLAESSSWSTAAKFFALVIMFIAAPLTFKGAQLLEKSVINKIDPDMPVDNRNRYQFLKRFSFWVLATGFAMIALLHGITIHHLLPIFHDRGIKAETAVIAASFIGPMQVMGRLTMMALEKHSSNHGITIVCFLVTGISILFLYMAGTTPTLLVAFVIVFGSGYGMVSVIRPVITRDLLGEQNFGTKSGVLALLFLAGSAIAPYLGALIWNLGGYDLVIKILFLLAALGLTLYLWANQLTVG